MPNILSKRIADLQKERGVLSGHRQMEERRCAAAAVGGDYRIIADETVAGIGDRWVSHPP